MKLSPAKPSLARVGAAALAAALVAVSSSALAQVPAAPATGTTRAADTARLNEALRTLSSTPQSLDALLAAGTASLRLEDVNGAQGFYRRAQTINAQDPRVKAGLGSVLVRQRRPLEALSLFTEAAQAGALPLEHIADRGLAYDLIGDNARAQQDYALALSTGPDPIVSRRLALSQAIAGNQGASDATLLPLLQRQDLAAYRTRAFALAIRGQGEEAVSIAETMLPATISGRMAPYLRYMPRLTRAQQAAAANLGMFPRSEEIGRDDPALAAYAASIGVPAGTRPAVATADARLAPSGVPMGRPALSSQPARPTPAPTSSPPQVALAQTRVRAAVASPVAAGRTALPAATPGPAAAGTAAALTSPAAAVVASQPLATATPPAATPAAAAAVAGSALPEVANAPQEAPAPSLALRPSTAAGGSIRDGGAMKPPVGPSPTLSAPPAAIPAATAPTSAIAATSPELAPAASTPVVVARLEPTTPAPAETTSAPATAAASAAAIDASAAVHAVSLSEAFADLTTIKVAPPTAAPGAVDVAALQRQRAAVKPAEKPAAPPKPPPVPSRQWVQVATGRDTKALAFDWKRLKREAGALLDKQNPSTADWGQTNRLVIGPFPTVAAADAMIGKLKAKKIDAFRFTSAVGEAVTALD